MKSRTFILLFMLAFLVLVVCCGEDATSPIDDNGDQCPDPSSNMPPTIDEIPDTTISVGDTLRVWAVGEDQDGDTLKYSVAVLDLTATEILKGMIPNVRIDSDEGELLFIPEWFDRPSRKFRVIVQDPCNERDHTDFTVVVEM